MTLFTYKARDKKSRIREGTIEAASRQQIFDLLKKYNLIATSITEKKKDSPLANILSLLGGVSLKSKVMFSRQLSTMINAGLSITQALKILEEQEKPKNKKFAEIINSVTSDIEGGLSFSAALVKFPKVFSPIYVSLVESGEASGKLDEVLDRIATQLEKDYDLKAKIKGAMMYPIFIVVVMLVVAGIVVTFVMPQLKSLFQESGAKLPIATQVLLGVSDFVRSFWWIVLLGILGAVFGIRYFVNTEAGRSFWDSMKLKFPITGKLTKNIYMARFTRTLATLISSGLPILDSLIIVSDTVGNIHYKKEIEAASRQVESGVNLAVPLENSKLFPTMVSHMIEVGEKTGSIDKILYKLADFFDNEVSNSVAVLSTMLEPVLLLIMGVGVGFFVGAVLLPVYKLASVM